MNKVSNAVESLVHGCVRQWRVRLIAPTFGVFATASKQARLPTTAATSCSTCFLQAIEQSLQLDDGLSGRTIVLAAAFRCVDSRAAPWCGRDRQNMRQLVPSSCRQLPGQIHGHAARRNERLLRSGLFRSESFNPKYLAVAAAISRSLGIAAAGPLGYELANVCIDSMA